MDTAQRPRSWLRRRWWLVFIVLVGLPALLARIALDPSNIEALLKQVATDKYALDLQVPGEVSLQVFPRPRLSLRGARLNDLQDRELATLERLEVDLPWRSLWTSPPPLGRIWMTDVRIQAGPALDDWWALFNTGPPSPTLHWPVIADGFSARRVRYVTAAMAETSADESPDEQDYAVGDVEIEAIDLDPLYAGAPLNLELAVHAQGHRFALRLSGRAEERGGALRIAGGEFEFAFGPTGDDDEALQAQGTADLSLFAAGGLRGQIDLNVEDPRWLAEQSGLALQQPLKLQAELTGALDYETDVLAAINSEELQFTGRWPIGGDAAAREAYLRGDYTGSDGLRLQGLELVRQPPAENP